MQRCSGRVKDAAVESWLAITSLLLLSGEHNSGDGKFSQAEPCPENGFLKEGS